MREVLPCAALLALLALTGCVSAAEQAAAERTANEEALAKGLPQGAAWIAVGGGEVRSVPDLQAALSVAPDAAHRFVFAPPDAGPREYRMAYLPEAGGVAGQEFAAALGLRLSRAPSGRAALARDSRRVVAGEGGTLPVRVSTPDGSSSALLHIFLDPDFDGPLLVPRSTALSLGLARFEIPGTVDVQVALGRPFAARRAHVEVRLAQIRVKGRAQAVFEAPPNLPR